ncbi:putative exodeoxyribonuclease V alpha subunit [Mycobacteroides abscessus MAB_030201_1061]|nr:putative exodeoxyribonuclease V alpha subunit [Mycobacteroides abscessus MAB_030201_1061]
MSLVEAFGEILEPADVHVAQRLTALASETDESVELAIALAVRALRGGSVCVDLRAVAAQVDTPSLPWPAADDWLAAVRPAPWRVSRPCCGFSATCCTSIGTGARNNRCAQMCKR